MAYKRIEYPKGLTPRGVAVFPHLNTPDSKFNPDKPVYKVNLRLSDTDAQPIVERIDAILAGLKAASPAALALLQEDEAERLQKNSKKAKPAELSYATATDADGNELEGETVLKFKANARRTTKKGETYDVKLPLFDAKKQPVTAEVWGGSVLRVSFTLRPWVNAKTEYGVKLALEAVQVLELRTKGQGDNADAFGFGEEEGYEAPAETPAVNNTASDSSDDGDF